MQFHLFIVLCGGRVKSKSGKYNKSIAHCCNCSLNKDAFFWTSYKMCMLINDDERNERDK